MKEVIAMLDKVADSLQAKGLIDEATQIDIIANTIEAGWLGDTVKTVIKLIPAGMLLFQTLVGTLQAKEPGSSDKASKLHTLMIEAQEAPREAQDVYLGDIAKFISTEIKDPESKSNAIRAFERFKDTLKKEPSKQKPVERPNI